MGVLRLMLLNHQYILKRFFPTLFSFSHNIYTGKRLRLHVLLVRAAAPDGQLLLGVGRLHVPERRMCRKPAGRRGVHVLPRVVGGGAVGEEVPLVGGRCGGRGKGRMR
jgi:hypothetical protein